MSARRIFTCFVVACTMGCVAIAGFVFAVRRNEIQWKTELLQKALDDVKQGNPQVTIGYSHLLPQLANDSDCRRIITDLGFFMTEIDATDAKSVSQFKNVTSMSFYCSMGTKDVLLAAQQLPIQELYFEMPDLSPEDYLLLKDFPQLKKVHFEQVMDEEWIERLKAEMPDVDLEAPFPRSKEPK